MAFDIEKTNFLLPKNWRLVRLGDIAKVNPEVINREYKKEIIRYIDISSVSSHKFDKPKVIQFNKAPSRARRKLRDNDFIISTVRPNLKQYVFLDKVEDNWICSTGFCVVRADNENLAWYLYALITSDIFTSYLTKVADGAVYPAFNPIEIEDAIIPMPTDFVIEKIANNIKCFNNKIHLNHQINQTLEQMAQAIFKSWFVDFDPVKAKMDALAQGADKKTATISAMATISGQSQDELASLKANRPNDYQRLYDIADAFPSEMVDGVPVGWEIKKIGDVAKFIKGKKPKTVSKYKEVGFLPYILVGNLSGNYTEYAQIDNLTVSQTKDTIISMDGSAGRVSIGHKGIVGSTLAKIMLTDEKYWAIFYCFLKSKEKDIQDNTTGTSVPHTDKARVMDYDFVLPSSYLMIFFNNIFSSYQDCILNNRQELKNLEAIRDNILPKLLNGEIEL